MMPTATRAPLGAELATLLTKVDVATTTTLPAPVVESRALAKPRDVAAEMWSASSALVYGKRRETVIADRFAFPAILTGIGGFLSAAVAGLFGAPEVVTLSAIAACQLPGIALVLTDMRAQSTWERNRKREKTVDEAQLLIAAIRDLSAIPEHEAQLRSARFQIPVVIDEPHQSLSPAARTAVLDALKPGLIEQLAAGLVKARSERSGDVSLNAKRMLELAQEAPREHRRELASFLSGFVLPHAQVVDDATQRELIEFVKAES